jgi:hypothetical protein
MRLPWRQSKLNAAPSGLFDYWATVQVRLHHALAVDDEDDPRPVIGYWRCFGLRVEHGMVHPHLEAAISDGVIDWEKSEYYEVQPSDLDDTIQRRIQPVVRDGIWYTSGRIFYPGDGEGATN